MAARSAEVKSYVLPDVKSKAAAVYARWGMSLSDAVNTFLIKSIEVGGLPFDMRPATGPVYNEATVLPIDPRFGSSVLPAEMDDEEGDLYDSLVR
ncbi:MAG: type II toxin-antitoxin system RelB/DinJ family antitoxin [Atopobiaceae bacterium]|nr:type II toxin-antitoxin system RelB/DinJ family antitoxin [Atopobiaceae bacterium]